jgi:hypothetical protein
MVIDVATVGAPPVTDTSRAVAESPGFDERWAAWQARGAAHEGAVRRRIAFAVPMLLLVAVVMYTLFGL